MMRRVAVYYVCICILFPVVLSRNHQLTLRNDIRRYFSISTFGFFNDGQLEVDLDYLTFLNKTNGKFGFTLTKTVSDSVTPYMESHQNKCLLVDDTFTQDRNVEIISFLLDPKYNEVRINCSRLAAYLEIEAVPDSNTSTVATINVKKPRHVAPEFHNVPQIIKQKRSVDDKMEATQTTTLETKVGPSKNDKVLTTSTTTLPPPTEQIQVTEEESKVHVESDNGIEATLAPRKTKSCNIPKLSFKTVVHDKWRQISNLKFTVTIKDKQAEGLYSLFFHNCADEREFPTSVNLSVLIIERNGDSYLSAGEIPLPGLYFFMSLIFFATGCLWISVLKKKKEETFKIHYLMGVLIFLKSLSLLFHGINFHIIAKEGYPIQAWAVLYYITHLLKGALLFITIVLIGTGWAFIKHILSDKDKKIFMIVIPMQVLANVAKIIMEESEEGDVQHYTWKEVFILVDLMCCGAILFPVVWSIRHLQEASQTDGKAAINLEKLKLFRHFYIMVVCYIYFTRIIVYLLKITVPFQYEWLDEMFREGATLIFFIMTGRNFRPTTSNPYFRLSQDDDEGEMDEVVTQTGFTEAATKTLRSRDVSNSSDQTTTTKRESSHEYD